MQENNIDNTLNQPTENLEPKTAAVPTTEPKTNNFIVILLSILLIISVLISAFFAYQTQKLVNELTSLKSENGTEVIETDEEVSDEPVSVDDPTANWKTYKNISLGFELKYPSTFAIDKEMDDQYNRATIFENGDSTFQVMLRDSKYFDRPLDEYYYMDNSDYTKSVLDGKNANVYVYDASKNSCVSDGNGPSCPISYVVYVAQNGVDLYHLGFFGDNKLSDLERQILSTFKFLD